MIKMSPSSVAWRLVLAMFAASAMNAHAGTSQSVAGTWWFGFSGSGAGALVVQLDEPDTATTRVQHIAATGKASFGYSSELGSFFVLAAGQPLSLDARGNLSGTLVLTDPNSVVALGELAIEGGTPNRSRSSWRLSATIRRNGGEPRRVRLRGRRVETALPAVNGTADSGSLSGRGIRQGHLSGLLVQVDPVLGAPAHTIVGGGTAQIRGVGVPDVSIGGTAMLAPDGRVVGLLAESSDFAPGDLSGTIRASKVSLTLRGSQSVRIRATLSAPGASPDSVLRVTPPLGLYGWSCPAVESKTFTVVNDGAHAFDGVVDTNGSLSFWLPAAIGTGGAMPLTLQPGESASITVDFDCRISSWRGVLRLVGEGGTNVPLYARIL